MPFKHPRSPFWQYDFVIDGYRFSGTTRCKNERDAREVEKAKRAEARQLVEAARTSGARPLTVGEACDRWWNEHGRHLKEAASKPTLDWIAEFLGRRTALHHVTDEMISRMVAARREHTRQSGQDDDGKKLYRSISTITVNKTTKLLRRVMRRARDNWNAAIFREPKWGRHMLKEIKRPVREITHAEEARLDAVESPDYAVVRRFAIIMGLRLGEVLLTWPQVDFENATIRIVGKGDKPATLPLTREAYAILWAQRGRHATHVFTFVQARNHPTGDPATSRAAGKRYPITRWGLANNRRHTWAKAGVDARFHDTRHTTGMRTLRATGNLRVTQALLRHSDVTTTARFYTDATLGDVREAMERTAEARPAAPLALPAPAAKAEGED